jgi:hypothetical protein
MKNFILETCSLVDSSQEISKGTGKGGVARAARRSRSQHRRLIAIFRVACRVLGLTRRRVPQGIGNLIAGAIISGLATSAMANDGIFINEGSDAGCVIINDGGGTATTTSTKAQCSPATKATQTDHVLFYGSVASGPSTSLTRMHRFSSRMLLTPRKVPMGSTRTSLTLWKRRSPSTPTRSMSVWRR